MSSTRKYAVKLPAVLVVGMHHYGSRALEVGKMYVLVREPGNASDSGAIAVRDSSGATKAHVVRDDAIFLALVMDEGYDTGTFHFSPSIQQNFVAASEALSSWDMSLFVTFRREKRH